MDVMVRDVVTAKPDDAVADAIKLLIRHDVSALPVVDDAGHVIGVISEADLVHREEIGTWRNRGTDSVLVPATPKESDHVQN
jgi:CBS domain-containing protein